MKVGTTINHYEVIDMVKPPSVALCRDLNLGLIRVIKADKGRKERESDILKRLDHRRIPTLIEVISGQDDYFIMDHIKGTDLQSYFHLNKISNRSFIQLLMEIASILEHVHCMNVIHGDLKPEHIVVNEVGCHLIDFGSAFIERDFGSFTLGYVAPERLLDTYLVDERSDIYSLGKLYEHMLNWYLKSNRMGIIKGRRLKKIIKKCLEVNPNERYQNATNLLIGLERIIFH